MTSSPLPSDAQLAPESDTESKLPALIYDLSQQVQLAMENMLKMTKVYLNLYKLHREIDQNSAEILEDIEKSEDSALQRKKNLEEEKEHFQKAAFAVLNMLNRDLN